MTERMSAGINPENLRSSIAKKPIDVTRQTLIEDHNLDTNCPHVQATLDKFDHLKKNATVHEFLPVIGEKLVKPFRRNLTTEPLKVEQ